jgi:hypothetical protein
MAEHGVAVPKAAGAAGGAGPGDEPRRRHDRSRSPRAHCAWHIARNVGTLSGGTAVLMATLKVVSSSADNLDRNVRVLCSDASGESLPVNYYQNISNAIALARELCKILDAMHVGFQTVTASLERLPGAVPA